MSTTDWFLLTGYIIVAAITFRVALPRFVAAWPIRTNDPVSFEGMMWSTFGASFIAGFWPLTFIFLGLLGISYIIVGSRS